MKLLIFEVCCRLVTYKGLKLKIMTLFLVMCQFLPLLSTQIAQKLKVGVILFCKGVCDV